MFKSSNKSRGQLMKFTYAKLLGFFPLKQVVFGVLCLCAAIAVMAVESAPPRVVTTVVPVPSEPADKKPPHVVTLRRPAGPPTATARNPETGVVTQIACATCHATRTPNFDNAATADLDLFHHGLVVKHGSNTCLSCHNSADYGSLHLANNKRVEFTDVVTLCSQCHGPQWRDFQHGAHGGMNGYWDLSKGDRSRNGCTSCHDPHAPKYQGAHPTLPPRDRFLETHHE